MKKYIFSFLATLLLFASCEKVINIDTSISDPQFVLNAVPSAEKQLFVNFAYTHFFLDTSNNHPISNIDMVVTINGNEYRPISNHRCNYFFDYTLQEDDQISIRVKSGDRTVTAQTYVPRMPQISQPIALLNDTGAFNFLVANFNIQDHPNYPNYYCFTITQHDSGEYYHPYLEYLDTIDTIRTTIFFCTDRQLTSPSSSNGIMDMSIPMMQTQLFATDSLIDGSTHNTSLFVMLLRDTNEIQPFIHEYTLNVECITPERMKYLQAIGANNSMLSFITEPPAMYTNVHGALGIFAGNAKRTYPLATISDGQLVSSPNAHKSTVAIPPSIIHQAKASAAKIKSSRK